MQICDETRITNAVNLFYETMPFNYTSSGENGAEFIRRTNQIKKYVDVDALFLKNKNIKILDVGCGAGWLSNSAAYYYGFNTLGIDLCQSAITRAIQISKILELNNIHFCCCNLFAMPLKQKFLFVNSLGCLHHTYNCKEALNYICNYVDDNGFIHVGLYHKWGRGPFLHIFKKYRDKIINNKPLTEEETKEALGIYRELNPTITDDTFLLSWFRDQVLHPHETQHTLQELYEWLGSFGFSIVSTSINKFKPIIDIETLFEDEKKYYQVSWERNVIQKKYFPGFFTILAKRAS